MIASLVNGNAATGRGAILNGLERSLADRATIAENRAKLDGVVVDRAILPPNRKRIPAGPERPGAAPAGQDAVASDPEWPVVNSETAPWPWGDAAGGRRDILINRRR